MDNSTQNESRQLRLNAYLQETLAMNHHFCRVKSFYHGEYASEVLICIDEDDTDPGPTAAKIFTYNIRKRSAY